MSKTISCLKFSIASIILPLVFVLPASAQSWQKQGTVSVPIVALGSACNGANDTIGLTADRTQLLTCQSGAWAKQVSASSALTDPTFCNAWVFQGNRVHACVYKSTGTVRYVDMSAMTNGTNSTVTKTGWPVEFATGSEAFSCGAVGASDLLFSCFAPATNRYCVTDLWATSSWYCIFK
jgi:hypothetical protein